MAGPRVAPQTVGGGQPQLPPNQPPNQPAPAQPNPAPQPAPAQAEPGINVNIQANPAGLGDININVNAGGGKAPNADPPAANNGQNGGLWAGFPEKTPNGNAHGWWRKHQTGQGQNPRMDWPILTQSFPRTNNEPDSEVNRRGDDRERQWNESYGANRTTLRRGAIRDYIRQNLQSTLLEARTGNSVPIEVQLLTRTVADRLSQTYIDTNVFTERTLNLIAKELSHLLGKEFTSATTVNPTVIPYDRAVQIASLVGQQIRAQVDPNFPQMTDRKMLDALIFLRLCCDPGPYMGDVKKIMSHQPCILPNGMPWSVFRDTGLLAASLFREGAAVRTPNGLDAAVERFTKLLVANNEIGVLLAAAQLTANARDGRVPSSSIIALVRIYELIAKLTLIAERSMKEAAAQKSPELSKSDRGLAFAGALESNEAESALRQYLAFNPSAQADTGACAFFGEQVADSAARIAVDSSEREMAEWLGSGRHRFVTETDLGKPLGIVIDRATDECFTASKIRVVLVRDGSVLGWHILRTSLVS